MSRTVKHPNACRLPGCQLCHYEKKAGRLPHSDQRRMSEFYEDDEDPAVIHAAFERGPLQVTENR